MGNVMHVAGEEFYTKFVWTRTVDDPLGVQVGLYDDATDALTETDDISAITTEPDGSAYSRITVTMDNTDCTANQNSNPDWEALFKDLTYDLSDSSSPSNLDSYFVVVEFQSEYYSDSAKNTHIMFTGALSTSYDVSSVDSLTVTDSGTVHTGNV